MNPIQVTHVYVAGMMLHVLGTAKDVRRTFQVAEASGKKLVEVETMTSDLTRIVSILVNLDHVSIVSNDHTMTLQKEGRAVSSMAEEEVLIG